MSKVFFGMGYTTCVPGALVDVASQRKRRATGSGCAGSLSWRRVLQVRRLRESDANSLAFVAPVVENVGVCGRMLQFVTWCVFCAAGALKVGQVWVEGRKRCADRLRCCGLLRVVSGRRYGARRSSPGCGVGRRWRGASRVDIRGVPRWSVQRLALIFEARLDGARRKQTKCLQVGMRQRGRGCKNFSIVCLDAALLFA
jgi:hypothetical protein